MSKIIVNNTNKANTNTLNNPVKGKDTKTTEERNNPSKGKKSHSVVFKKRTQTPQTLGGSYDIDGKSIQQLMAHYNSLRDVDKVTFLQALAKKYPNKLGKMYFATKDKQQQNEMLKMIAENTPQRTFENIFKELNEKQKPKFLLDVIKLTNDSLTPQEKEIAGKAALAFFNSVLDKMSKEDKINTLKNLSAKLKEIIKTIKDPNQKTQVQDFIMHLDKVIADNVNGKNTDMESGGNVMWVMIQVFCKNMNTQGLDEISQMNDTKLANKYLDIAQHILNKNLANENNIINGMNQHHSKLGFWIGLAATLVVSFAIAFLTCGAGAAVDAGVTVEIGTQVGAEEAAAGATTEVATQTTEEAAQATTEFSTESVQGGADDIEMSTISRNMETQTEKTVEENSLQGGGSDETASQASEPRTEPNSPRPSQETQTESPKEPEANNSPKTDGAKKPSNAKSPNKATKGGKSWKKIAGNTALYFLMTGGLYYQTMGRAAPYNTPGGSSAPMSGKDSAEISKYQSSTTLANNVITQSNNKQQTTAKRMEMDCDNISKDSGDIQQAGMVWQQIANTKA